MSGPSNGKPIATTPGRRCAIYTRKSTAHGLEQEFSSLDAQREACERYIETQTYLGWTVLPDPYDDGGFTGANLERPAFQRLMADIEAGKIDIVVVYKVDRLSRSLLDFARVMGRFNDAHTAFVSVTQNFSTADAMGRLTLNMLISFAEFEREMIAERTRDKIHAARRRGQWTGGQVPIGYRVENKHLIVDELEALIVREIFDLYEEHRSALTVAQLLNDRGRRTKHHTAANGNVRKARPWTKDRVLRVLKSPIYAGYMPCKDEVYEGEHEALIDRDRFRRIQAVLDTWKDRRTPQHGRNPEYLLRGLLYCRRCNVAMTPASTGKNGRVYRYYRCISRDHRGKRACPTGHVPAAGIEDYVVGRLRESSSEGLADDVSQYLNRCIAKRRKDLEVERSALPGAIATLSSEGKELVEELRGMTGPGRRLLELRLREFGEQLSHSETRLAEVERQLAILAGREVEARWVGNMLTDLDRVWDAMGPENHGKLLRAVIDRVLLDETNGAIDIVLADLEVDLDADLTSAGAMRTAAEARA